MERTYAEYAARQAMELLAIDSPTGFTARAADWVQRAFEELGYTARRTAKGGVLVDLGGRGEGLLLEAHADTLGGMVAEVKNSGRLRLTPLGGMRAENGEAENVRVYTRGGRVLEGTFQLCNASIHVNGQYGDTKRTFDSCEVVLDEDVKSAEETRTLGVEVGDVVCFEPRTRLTASGYIKSRFLDDKLSVGILLGLAKYLKDTGTVPQRHVYLHVTVYEEVGHGGAANVPQGVTEAISVDMGCVGEGLQCTERQVSICAKDSGGPYSYEVVGKLIDAARRTGADYAVDVYPHYGSDVEATLSAGHDLRHGLIGAGVYASHGYERSHVDGVWNTLKVLAGYLEADGVRYRLPAPAPPYHPTPDTECPDPGRLRGLCRPVPGCPAQPLVGLRLPGGAAPSPGGVVPAGVGGGLRRRAGAGPCGAAPGPVHRGGGVHPLRRPRHGGTGLPHRCRLCRPRLRHRGLCRRSGVGPEGLGPAAGDGQMLPGESSLPAYAGLLYGPHR